MSTEDLLRKIEEVKKEEREASERLALIRKQTIARINKQLAKVADKKTIISFEESE